MAKCYTIKLFKTKCFIIKLFKTLSKRFLSMYSYHNVVGIGGQDPYKRSGFVNGHFANFLQQRDFYLAMLVQIKLANELINMVHFLRSSHCQILNYRLYMCSFNTISFTMYVCSVSAMSILCIIRKI